MTVAWFLLRAANFYFLKLSLDKYDPVSTSRLHPTALNVIFLPEIDLTASVSAHFLRCLWQIYLPQLLLYLTIIRGKIFTKYMPILVSWVQGIPARMERCKTNVNRQVEHRTDPLQKKQSQRHHLTLKGVVHRDFVFIFPRMWRTSIAALLPTFWGEKAELDWAEAHFVCHIEHPDNPVCKIAR